MPELPDVEVFRQYFEATSLHQGIESAQVLNDDVLSNVSARQFQNRVRNHQFDASRRHGKYLFVHLNNDGWLVFHFGMTGYFDYFKGKHKAPKHTRLLFQFANDYQLAYVSQRKLGKVSFVEDPDDFLKDQGLGPDALSESADLTTFSKALESTRSAIKPALMNQGHLAGVGNIYSDEVLFQAKIHPETKANRLGDAEVRRLFHTLKEVLKTAIDGKADPEQMPDSYLLPHRQKGGKCPACGGNLKREKISGRTAYYCPRCQGRDK